MSPLHIIDSHVHLWPENMSNEQGHSWMTPEMPLAKEHLLSVYYEASNQGAHADHDTIVDGVIYVETDVKYDEPCGELSAWAKGPLDEIKFLRAIVEGRYGPRDSQMLLGIVAWAPMDQPPHVLEEWLRIAQEAAGIETWSRVKGFRFLLQAIHDQNKFESLVLSEDFVENLKILGKKGFSFDIGVDEHSGGIWQLEAISKTMEMAHRGVPEDERIGFIINHLCKPDFANQGQEFLRWCSAIKALSKRSRTYMKLSGAFSELQDGLISTGDIVARMEPWVEQTFQAFGPDRMMFGSDWPVCNIKGPRKEASWISWREVVEAILDGRRPSLSNVEKERVWSGTALEAYRVARNAVHSSRDGR